MEKEGRAVKHLRLASTAIVVASASLTANAQQYIQITAVQINGISLEIASGFMNPTFTLFQGDDLDFNITVERMGERIPGQVMVPGEFLASFTTMGGDLSAPSEFGMPGVLPTEQFPRNLFFSRSFDTIGSWTGNMRVDLTNMTGDYQIPSGGQADFRDLGFIVNVIPLPSAVGLGAAGLALVALRRRRTACERCS